MFKRAAGERCRAHSVYQRDHGPGSLHAQQARHGCGPISPRSGICALRFTMPAAACSYCTGETRIGEDYQMGMMKKMEIR